MYVVATPAQAPIDLLTSKRNDAANRERIRWTSVDEVRHFVLHVHHAFKVRKGERVLPLHHIVGEPFEMMISEGVIVLQHQQWSLHGEGTTLLEAEQNLLDFAIAISPAYVRHPNEKLTKRAQVLKDFLLKVI